MPFFDDVKDIFTIKDDDYYYNKLYPLQDKVLTLAFSKPTNFYLSGGTTLNRFILPKQNGNLPRHSDDLDFFINLDNSKESIDYFHRAKEAILEEIRKEFTVEAEKNLQLLSEYKVLSDNSFIYYAYDGKVKLKLQFVLDHRAKSNNSFCKHSHYRLDNIHNILTNKIATLKYREEFKDFVDLYNIAQFNKDISWSNAIEQTAKTTKVVGLTAKEFKKIANNLLTLYRSFDTNTLTKQVIFGQDKAYQKKMVSEILDGFEELIIDRI